MNIQNKREILNLFLGDVFFLYTSLFLMLFLIFLGGTEELFIRSHLNAFSLLFIVWFLVFFIAGLYEKHTLAFKSKIPNVILNAQIVNSILAVFFFYFVPYFSIAPKTNLFIYLIISFGLILFWRIYGYPKLGVGKKENALIVGGGKEIKEIVDEVNNNSRYHFYLTSIINPDGTLNFEEEFLEQITKGDISSVIVDFEDERITSLLSKLNNTLYLKVKFFDREKVYEDIFDRVPLPLLKYNWFLENISTELRGTYDTFKRIMDVLIALPLSIVPIIIFPFAAIAMKLEDGGPVFSHQNRIGQNNQVIRILKFRSMLFNDAGEWKTKGVENKVTRVGNFLRKTRLDEFPQLWNVLKGDLSLIGPRPEFPEPVSFYNNKIPYYNIRHLIKPGLSGWAQIYHDNHPHHGTDVYETGVKLSYDLYYIKNRSFMLDLKIALRTIRSLLSRGGV